jgi:hypothetical protein
MAKSGIEPATFQHVQILLWSIQVYIGSHLTSLMSMDVVWHSLQSKQEVLGRTDRLLSFDTTRAAHETMRPTCIRSRRNVLTEPLPGSYRGLSGLEGYTQTAR